MKATWIYDLEGLLLSYCNFRTAKINGTARGMNGAACDGIRWEYLA